MVFIFKLRSCAALVLSTASIGIVSPALAAPEDSDKGLEVVVVTAQKRETNAQTTPIAMSVLGGEQLRARKVESLADLATSGSPSLRIAPFFSRSSALTVGIRGIVPFDANQPSRDAGVGVYIDGVYLGRSQGLGAALFDIERIEILKGPQGTLFGRNSTGGAVSIISKKPTGEFGLRQTFGVRNFGGYNSQTNVDFDEINNVAIKVDAIVSRRDGTVNNTLEGEEDFNKYDRKGLHIGALWRASETLTAHYDVDISKDITTPYYVQLIDKNPATAPLAPLVQVQLGRAKQTDIGVPQGDSVGNIWGHMLHVNWKPAPGIEVRSISSYRKLEQTQLDNGIGAHTTPFRANANFARYSLASLRQEQVSQEFQVLGTLSNLTYVVGTYLYHEEGDDDAWTPNTLTWNATGTAVTRLPTLAAGAATAFPDRASTARADSRALFGQFTWSPASFQDRLHVTAGARYTHDQKSGKLTKVNGANTNFTFNIASDRVDPMITIAYDPIESLHLYAKWGTAYRAGGANSRSVNYRAFDEETVETSEIGMKSEWFDRRARINLAAYSTAYKDIQIDFSAVNLLNSNRGTLETVNAPGEGKIEGFEADITLAPISGLTLALGYAYTKGELPRAANPFNNNALQNVFIVYTPENAFNASIDYQRPIGGGAIIKFHLDANQSEGYNSSSGDPALSDESLVVNGRIAVSDINIGGGRKMQLSLWSRNLLDESHTFYESRAGYAGFGAFGIYNEPQTYGLDATFSF
jgi:iron complex outermembrane recepter protein